VTEAEYRVDGHGYRTAASKGGAHPAFECEFAAIPKNKPFRAQARTPRPQAGLQTARVIAPEGDDIAAEKYLQVKVEFHWESFNPPAAGKRMQRAWVRVAQHWAGKSRGALFVPRAGEEVVIAFVDGDPDHPIVVGSVYNSSNETPYALPAHGAVSGIRTSSLGRDGERNELRFNDKDLQLLLYTGGRHDNYVKGESLTWVGKDAHLIVEKKQLMKLGEHHATVDGASHVKVGRGASWKAGADMVHEAGMTYAASGKNVRIHAGLNVVIEAGAELTLKAGSSFITLNPAGVQISSGAGLILLNSGGAAAVAPSASPGSPSEPKKADDGSSVK
jgi:type VI secretion system secreted protein VgrG